MFGHSDSTCLGAELIKRRLEVAAAEDGGVAGAVRDRSPAHAVLASAAAPVAFLQPAGFPSWVGSVVVGQLEKHIIVVMHARDTNYFRHCIKIHGHLALM